MAKVGSGIQRPSSSGALVLWQTSSRVSKLGEVGKSALVGRTTRPSRLLGEPDLAQADRGDLRLGPPQARRVKVRDRAKAEAVFTFHRAYNIIRMPKLLAAAA